MHSNKWDYSDVEIICDIIDMPLDDETIDIVLCSEVFEHLRNPILAIKEFARVLRPGGELILTAPFCSLTHMAPWYYYNGFSEYWYDEHLKDYGFEIKESIKSGNYFKYLSQEMFRLNEMAIRYCNTTLDAKEIDTTINAINMLTSLSKKDTNSNETLCFGYMILAKKIDYRNT